MKQSLLALCLIAVLGFGSCYTSNKLKEAYKLSLGMSKFDVQNILGSPTKSEVSSSVEEWHYCQTNFSKDEFLAVFFHEDKLIERINYTVSVKEAGGAGDCAKFVKMGSYEVPTRVVELRKN